jgi:hypothetical protein
MVSVSVSFFFLGVVARAGDLNDRVKGIANCTKAEVPAQLPGRVSSKGPPQYARHQLCPVRVWTGL